MSFTEQQYASLNKVQLDESWKYNLAEFLLSPKWMRYAIFCCKKNNRIR